MNCDSPEAAKMLKERFPPNNKDSFTQVHFMKWLIVDIEEGAKQLHLSPQQTQTCVQTLADLIRIRLSELDAQQASNSKTATE